MNYILYNPKANNERDELNVINDSGSATENFTKISLIGLDTREFCSGLSESDRLIICGGDGTLHHFANNVYDLDIPCPVCVLRSGTGNDFLNDIGQLEGDASVDIREYLKDLPVVEVNGKSYRFINGAGLGVDGAVCNGVDEFKAKTNKKKANYTLIALKQLAYKYKRPHATLTIDGEVREYDNVWAMSSMKGKYYGGGMMIAPLQDRNSGKISVMAMHGDSRVKTLLAFTKVNTGEHIKFTDLVEIYEGNEIKVEFDAPCYMQIDGEVIPDVLTYTVHSHKK